MGPAGFGYSILNTKYVINTIMMALDTVCVLSNRILPPTTTKARASESRGFSPAIGIEDITIKIPNTIEKQICYTRHYT